MTAMGQVAVILPQTWRLATGGLRPEPAAQYDPLLLFVSAFSVPWIFAEERYEQEDKSCKEADEKHKVELDTAGL